MRNEVGEGEIWKLIVIRDGSDNYTHALFDAHFKYGRTSDELELLDVKRLPSGLIQLVEEHPFNLYEEALETGFIVEMTRRGSKAGGWMKFTSSVIMNSSEPFQSPRGLYANEIGSTLEFQRVGCPGNSEQLPKDIWLRVKELPLNYIAWAFENGIFEGSKGYQKTLDSWISLPELSDITPILVLPGKPTKSQNFI